MKVRDEAHDDLEIMNSNKMVKREVKHIELKEDGDLHVVLQSHLKQKGVHYHGKEYTKAIVNRLSRANGHLEAVKRMVEEERDCSEVIIQLSAVISALRNTSKAILKEHLEYCVVEALEVGDREALKDVNKAIESLFR